ncbi:MAG TPA: DUF1697 domain-containing protein [Pyrinomonadaceae bacterium]|nr:DUF1697 domain-containing protein [Pyrinomonadaceae bacterium]
MPKYVAFLRAINVGGHLVKMDYLRTLFEALGFSKVETFIASGNVIFDSSSKKPESLEKKIEQHLLKQLGYPVETFLRTVPEVAMIAQAQPFSAKELNRDGNTLYVGFLAAVPSAASQQELASCANNMNDFAVIKREVFWLCRAVKFSETDFSGARLEKILKLKTTLRNINTAKRIAAKYSALAP